MEKTSFGPIVILIFLLIRFLWKRGIGYDENADREPEQDEASSPHEQYKQKYQDEFENEEEPSHTDEPKAKDLFVKCRTIEEVKKRFRRLSMLNHPDRGGSAAAMKVILAQYEEALGRYNKNKSQ